MRTIQKRQEPASLTEYRHSPGANYNGFRDKDALRSHLVREQRGLCCYCVSPIGDDPGEMKIEHWHCRARYAEEELTYSNLLAACKGGEGAVYRNQHCDTRKGDRDISRNPANRDHHVEDTIRYLASKRL